MIDGTSHNLEVLGPMATYQAQRGFKMPFICKSPIVRRLPRVGHERIVMLEHKL